MSKEFDDSILRYVEVVQSRRNWQDLTNRARDAEIQFLTQRSAFYKQYPTMRPYQIAFWPGTVDNQVNAAAGVIILDSEVAKGYRRKYLRQFQLLTVFGNPDSEYFCGEYVEPGMVSGYDDEEDYYAQFWILALRSEVEGSNIPDGHEAWDSDWYRVVTGYQSLDEVVDTLVQGGSAALLDRMRKPAETDPEITEYIG